jgi:hypothetical protein
LTYENLKNKPKELLSATGLTVEEFEYLLPAFEAAKEWGLNNLSVSPFYRWSSAPYNWETLN